MKTCRLTSKEAKIKMQTILFLLFINIIDAVFSHFFFFKLLSEFWQGKKSLSLLFYFSAYKTHRVNITCDPTFYEKQTEVNISTFIW